MRSKATNEGWAKASVPFRVVCEDCGQVHTVTATTATGDPIYLAAKRDNRSTGQRRRRMRERTDREALAKAGPELALEWPTALPHEWPPKLHTPNLL